MPQRKQVNYTVIFSAAMILIIVVAVWGYFSILDEGPGVPFDLHVLSEEFYDGPDPVAGNLPAYTSEGMSTDEISALLGEKYDLIAAEEDINADGYTEFVVVERNPAHPLPHSSLQRAGYTQTIEGLIVYRRMDETLLPVLAISEEVMRDERGNVLIGQVRAENGYAFQVYDYDNEDIFAQTVKLFDVVLLDEQGRADSDDITIYWNPASGLYQATNTFGAPGTFGD